MPLFSYTTQSKLSYTLCWSVPLIFPKLKLAHSFELIFKLTKAFQIISHKNYHFNLNDEFFISLTSKLMSSCTDCFTLGMKSQSLVCLLSASEYIYIYIGIWALKSRCFSVRHTKLISTSQAWNTMSAQSNHT